MICLICDKEMEVLNIHVLKVHGLTWSSYKETYGVSRNTTLRIRSVSTKKPSANVCKFTQKFYRAPWTSDRVEQMLKWWPHFGTYAMALRLGLTNPQVKSKANAIGLKLLPDSERLCIDCLKPGHWKRHIRCHDCALIDRQKKRRDITKPLDKWIMEMIRTARYRSNHACDLNLEYMVDMWKTQDATCFYCGQQLSPPTYGKGRDLKTASVDRLDPSKTYMKGNVTWSCWGCNWMKSKMTVQEFITKCAQVVHHRGSQQSLGHDTTVHPETHSQAYKNIQESSRADLQPFS